MVENVELSPWDHFSEKIKYRIYVPNDTESISLLLEYTSVELLTHRQAAEAGEEEPVEMELETAIYKLQGGMREN